MLSADEYEFEDTLDEAARRRKERDFELDNYSLTPSYGADALGREEAMDEQKLVQAWINERSAPALLKYQDEVVRNLKEALDLQDSKLEREQGRDLASDAIASLCREEMERIKFALRSYLRTRLDKIERYCKYILSSRKEREKLSDQEMTFAQRYLRLVEGHFQGAVLEQLPSDLQKLDDTAQGLSMVNSPDINTAVFVKVVEDLPTIADGRTRVEDAKAGSIYIMRYSTIQVHLEREQVELL